MPARRNLSLLLIVAAFAVSACSKHGDTGDATNTSGTDTLATDNGADAVGNADATSEDGNLSSDNASATGGNLSDPAGSEALNASNSAD